MYGVTRDDEWREKKEGKGVGENKGEV